jgi:hypothetical protein
MSGEGKYICILYRFLLSRNRFSEPQNFLSQGMEEAVPGTKGGRTLGTGKGLMFVYPASFPSTQYGS